MKYEKAAAEVIEFTKDHFLGFNVASGCNDNYEFVPGVGPCNQYELVDDYSTEFACYIYELNDECPYVKKIGTGLYSYCTDYDS